MIHTQLHPLGRGRAFVAFVAAGLSLAVALQVAAAQRRAHPVRTPPPAVAAAPAAPVTRAEPVVGLCQCIADRTERRFSCLSSPQECQATCASTVYSFVPRAPSCPLLTSR